ncbi:MAG: hypothetical protein ACRDM0_18670, partial [Thermoleophilaceae bacterium]
VLALALIVGQQLAVIRRGGSPPSSPDAASTMTPGPARESPTPSPSPARALDFPALQLLVGSNQGTLYRIDGSGAVLASTALCPGRAVWVHAAPSGTRAVAICSPSDPRTLGGEAYLIALTDGGDLGRPTRVPVAVDAAGDTAAWSLDGSALALLGPGDCPFAGIPCNKRLVLYDIRTGDSRLLRAEEPLLGTLKWTPLGLTVFRTGVGTFLLQGSTWTRLSEHELILADSSGRALLHQTSFIDRGGSVVWERAAGGAERQLTDPRASEYGAALLSGGRSLVWRDQPQSAMVTYEDGRLIAQTPGGFWLNPVRSGDWLATTDVTGMIRAYSIAQAGFASWPGSLSERPLSLTVIAGPP